MIIAAIAVPHPPLLLPEIGRGQERAISDTTAAYEQAMRFLCDQQPDAIVLLTPHTAVYQDYFHISPGPRAKGDFSRYGSDRVVKTEYDEALAARIAEEAAREGVYAGFEGEREAALDHAAMIPLAFLQAHASPPIIRIGLSGLGPAAHYRLGQCIARASEGKRVGVIASGDLSHRLKEDGPYGFAPEGPVLDRSITRALADGDFQALLEISPELSERGADCGLGAFCIMAGSMDGRAVQPAFLSYEGPYGVGYAVATFLPGEEDSARRFLDAFERREAEKAAASREHEDAYVRLARQTVEGYVRNGKAPPLPDGLPDELTKLRAGVFVSIHKHGRLRGCIGTIAPAAGSVAEEIRQNAVSASARDPRFLPVEEEELPYLHIKVDVLGQPEPIASPAELDVRRYGVIVRSGGKTGLLLPDLEGVDTVEEQVRIASEKAGIRKGQPIALERFEVKRHG